MEAGSQKRAPVYEALEQLKKEKSRSFRCAGAQERAWQPGARGTSGGEMCESGCEFHEAA